MDGYHSSSFKSFYLNVDVKSYPSGKLRMTRKYCKRKYACLEILYWKLNRGCIFIRNVEQFEN